MKKTSTAIAALTVVAAIAVISGCTNNENAKVSQSEIDSLKNQIVQLTSGNQLIENHLAKFDTLDYTVFSNQEWTRLHESHSNDIKVYWPDGHVTTGIEKHIADLKAMFVYAPDTRISYSVRFRKHDCCNRCVRRNIYQTNANRKRKIYSTHRQSIQNANGYNRSMGNRRYNE
jgi:hypothetical protein